MKKSSRDALPVSHLVGFHCKPIGARLLRTSCGARHENASRPWEPGTRKVKVWSTECATCELGAAHGRGEQPRRWPDGTPVLEVNLVPVSAIVRHRPLTRKERGALI